jgi:hypothetical protein
MSSNYLTLNIYEGSFSGFKYVTSHSKNIIFITGLKAAFPLKFVFADTRDNTK